MGMPILSLITPANAGVVENGNVRLSASYTDAVHAYIADITFEIDTVNTFDSANLESHLYEDVPSATTLGSFFELADGLYYWRVTATNTTGTTVSSVQNFTVSDKRIRALYTYANVGKYRNLEKRTLYTIANVGKLRVLKKRALYTFENISKKNELKARALYEYENITDDPPWPTIYGISGTRFSQGAELTITGSGFGFSTADDIANEDRFERSYDGSVIFGGQSVNVISWSWNSITITLPSDAESGSLFVRLSSPTVRDSNFVGVEVYEAEVADDIGVEFYLCDHKQPNTVIKQLAFARNKSFQVLLNGAGSGSFEIDLADAEGISDKMAVLCRLDGIDVHKWIIENIDINKADSSEKQTMSCSGRGMMALLERAVVYPETMQSETERTFSGVHGGDILRQLLLEAQNRGAIPYVNLEWTAGFDSIGQPWEDLTDVSFHVGTPLLSVVDKLSNGLGLFDIEMTPNLKLKIYHRHGTDVSDEVVYELGQAIIEHSAPSQSDGLVNVALVEGENGIMIEVADGSSPATWGRHEGYLQSRNVPDELSLDTFGRAYIDYSAQPERSIIGRVTKFVYDDGRKIKPFESYLLGDWVGWYVDDFQVVRVKGITVEEDTETGEPSYTLDLNNILLERQIRMNQQLSRVSMNSADSPLTSTGDKPPLTELPAHNHSHTTLTDLDNDDHTQYLNEQRHSEVDHSMIVYTLPQATETVLGGVKAKAKTTESGEVAIDGTTGKLYAPSGGGSYTLPQATGSTLGGVKAKAKTSETGEVAIDGATGKLFAPESSYSLPQADATTLGGIKAKPKTSETGEVAIDGATGKLYAPSGGGSYTLPQANETTLGGIKAKEKTSESSEVAIDSVTGKLYAPEIGSSLPAGGPEGYFLKKNSATDGDVSWTSPPIKLFSEGGMVTEDFEDDILLDNLSITGDYDFQAGLNSLRSLHHRTTTPGTFDTTITIDMPVSAEVSFYYKCSVRSQYDTWNQFSVLVNNELKFSSVVDTPWTKYNVELSAGQHTITFRNYSYWDETYWSEWWLDDLVVPGDGLTGMTAVSANADKLLATSIDGTHVGFLSKSTFITAPATEGTAGQVLTTDGAGERSWQTIEPSSVAEIPMATETTLGGVKAKAKTSETIEVAIESVTGKLFVPAQVKIADLVEKTTPAETDLMVIQDAQDTKRMTWANVVKPIEDLIDTHVSNLNLVQEKVTIQELTGLTSSYLNLTELKVNKIGNCVTIYGRGNPSATIPAATSVTLFELPIGWRPSVSCLKDMYQPNIMNAVRVTFSPTGSVLIYVYGSNPLEVNYRFDMSISFLIA